MPNRHRTLPGFDSPAVGFEQPYEMLAACHERVQRSLDLLARLIAHVRDQGHDAQSRSAARDVLRYFDLAAPQHHLDEERHVFPRLLDSGCALQVELALRLQAEHREMEELWKSLREDIQNWCTTSACSPPSDIFQAQFARYNTLYASHIDAEEKHGYPAARAMMHPKELDAMGSEMTSRRRPFA